MKKLNFSTRIDATPGKVWEVLWKDESYRKWTSVFSEGSYAETDWQEGSRVKFLGPGGDGMLSEIAKKVPEQTMSFLHLGMIKDGREITEGPEIADWKGAMESYHLRASGSGTDLTVELDISEDHEEYFRKTFPVALQKVKELAEGAKA